MLCLWKWVFEAHSLCVVKVTGYREAAPPSGQIRDDKTALPALETRWIPPPILTPKIYFVKQKCLPCHSLKAFPSPGRSIFRTEVLH